MGWISGRPWARGQTRNALSSPICNERGDRRRGALSILSTNGEPRADAATGSICHLSGTYTSITRSSWGRRDRIFHVPFEEHIPDFKLLPRSRHDPKVLGRDDAEVVGDRISSMSQGIHCGPPRSPYRSGPCGRATDSRPIGCPRCVRYRSPAAPNVAACTRSPAMTLPRHRARR